MAMMPVADALERLLADANALETERVGLHDAQQRVLAQDIVALRTQPPFTASAMDGYAVRADDIAETPATLDVIGAVAAGEVFAGRVEPGQTVRIFTGAPLPDGADAILIQENAEPAGDGKIRALQPVTAGRYLRPAGLDFAEGDLLLEKGTLLDAGHLSLAAAGNHARLPVIRRPRIGVLATGDELVAPGSETDPGQIVASNSFGVAAIARDAGAEVIDLGMARDNAASLEARLDAAIAANCDVFVTLGGASVGDHDLVRPVFTGRGMTLDFYKIAMRPGKPMMFGRLGAMRVLGLPGNPVSSLVCTHLFVVPLLEMLGGRPQSRRRTTARLGAPIGKTGPREHYMRASLARGDDGILVATAFDNQDSSIIRLYAAADALIVRAPDAPAVDVGDMVEIVMLREPR
ncbi:MAG: molybdopterin molybdotransferase MoeA [Roseitalea sp.]|jgi:molybdopterin molybdotransferase|nr:molybdopterin molybdotransferase MoeA [Roseitalea sp.]MBO6723724.1 molybdopterin molybdotransferase MoeA [Roseitalea sp.]MBO6744315.1 molybdopterin molybdotransferase MoeA [Roseitalea sp.]